MSWLTNSVRTLRSLRSLQMRRLWRERREDNVINSRKKAACLSGFFLFFGRCQTTYFNFAAACMRCAASTLPRRKVAKDGGPRNLLKNWLPSLNCANSLRSNSAQFLTLTSSVFLHANFTNAALIGMCFLLFARWRSAKNGGFII